MYVVMVFSLDPLVGVAKSAQEGEGGQCVEADYRHPLLPEHSYPHHCAAA